MLLKVEKSKRYTRGIGTHFGHHNRFENRTMKISKSLSKDCEITKIDKKRNDIYVVSVSIPVAQS